MRKRGTITAGAWWPILGIGLAALSAGAAGAPAASEPGEVLREYVVSTWQHEHGLPDNRVRAILQTRDGYLWLVTQGGLARFDGQKFAVFDDVSTPEPGDRQPRCLAEDLEGNLWIGMCHALLRKSGRQFTRFTVREGLAYYEGATVCVSRSGGVWVGDDSRLYHVRGREIKGHACEDGLFPPGCLYALDEEESGAVWLGTKAGLFRFDPKQDRCELAAADRSFAGLGALGLWRSPSGERWVLFVEEKPFPSKEAERQKAWLACLKDGNWVRTPNRTLEDFRWEQRSRFLAPDQFGALWLPGTANGLHRFVQGEFQFLPMPHLDKEDFALCAHGDREGNVWIGTEASGLQRWTPRKVLTCSTREGLAHDMAWTICEARDGSVWIGTDGGLSQFKEGRFTHFTQTNGLSRNEVRAVVETRDGTIWVGTLNGLDAIRDGKVSHVRFPGEWFETKIRALLPARDGALWVGTVRGLTRLHDGQRTQYTRADGLGAEEVRALLEDRAGNLWVGTLGGGLTQLAVPPSGGGFDHERADSTNAADRLKPELRTLTITNGLSNNNVWALQEDADGALWIGTERGLNRLKDGQITVFTTGEGLPDNLVNTLLEDDFGRLWVGHDRGIYWVAKQQLNDVADGRAKSVHAVRYDQTDGLLTGEVNGQKSFPAACKTRDGRLWFPTVKGVAIINPAKVAPDAVPPLTVVEEIRAGGETVFDNGPAAQFKAPSPKSEADADTPARQSAIANRQSPILRLPPGRGRVLEFRFTASAFVAPEKVRFRYRMTGLAPNWIDVGTRREVFFTDLRPGGYEFEVIAASHHGVWPDRGARVAVQLAPFIYQTWWFYVVCALAATGLVGGVVAWRLRELRRIHRLEQHAAIAAERTRIAKDLHDGLGADLSRLTLLADLASGEYGADTGEHIRKLSHTSRQAARDLKELIWIANPANDTVDGLVSRICQNAEDFLRDAGIRCRFDLAPHLPQRALSLDQRRNLLLVVREAINNVVKHAAATEVHIKAEGCDNSLHLAIEDNGRGFDPASVQPGTLGLVSMRQRLENLGGSFRLESRPGAGTKIVIELNLAQQR